MYGKLAFTGAGISVAGIYVSAPWLACIAVGMTALGALLVRFGYRRNRSLGDA